MLSSKLHSSIGNTDQLYVDDVFSAYTYSGNGSTQTINNGIDLAGKGGLVWLKSRDIANAQMLYDTIRGGNQYLSTNATNAQSNRTPSITSWNQNGFSVAGNDGNISYSGYNYISWTFRKAPKFFDVVSYTGNGANRTITHSLGIAPGMIIVKRTDTTGDWHVFHRSLAATEYMVLNSTSAKATDATRWNSTSPTDTVFSLGTDATVNASGGTYIAYLFAHDASADGIVQCGSFTGTGAISVNLGWEPQYVLVKCSSDSSSNWNIFDSARGMPVDNTFTGGEGNDKRLSANSTLAEVSLSSIEPNATGFSYIEFGSLQTFIYLAIRRSNKPPTTGTQVYNAIARTGTSAAATVTGVGFAPDAVIVKDRADINPAIWGDRLRGVTKYLFSSNTNAEGADAQTFPGFDVMDGFRLGTNITTNWSGHEFINHFFHRAKGFFDVVCYTGTGSAQTVNHSLGVAPELMIVKSRSNSQSWHVFGASLPGGYGTASSNPFLYLNLSNAVATGFPGLTAAPTSSVLSIDQTYLSFGGYTYVAYLFASLPGISKVGSYTGNGSSQTINCGFTTGARFILIKRTDVGGGWVVFDTARGITSGNDPMLLVNSTISEYTTYDAVDPDPTGFVVNYVDSEFNVSGGTYLYLAIS